MAYSQFHISLSNWRTNLTPILIAPIVWMFRIEKNLKCLNHRTYDRFYIILIIWHIDDAMFPALYVLSFTWTHWEPQHLFVNLWVYCQRCQGTVKSAASVYDSHVSPKFGGHSSATLGILVCFFRHWPSVISVVIIQWTLPACQHPGLAYIKHCRRSRDLIFMAGWHDKNKFG